MAVEKQNKKNKITKKPTQQIILTYYLIMHSIYLLFIIKIIKIDIILK